MDVAVATALWAVFYAPFENHGAQARGYN
jgi:hypothetical protein